MCDRSNYVSDVFFFQAEDGIRDLVRSRGLGDVYKRQGLGVHGELLVRGPSGSERQLFAEDVFRVRGA